MSWQASNTTRELGGILEIVDTVSGMVRELSVLPPKEPTLHLFDDDAEENIFPHSPAKIVKVATFSNCSAAPRLESAAPPSV